MSQVLYHICSQSDCDFSTTDVDDLKCGKCASDLVLHCPNCKNYINQGINVFCTKCGHYLKQVKKSIYEDRALRSLL